MSLRSAPALAVMVTTRPHTRAARPAALYPYSHQVPKTLPWLAPTSTASRPSCLWTRRLNLNLLPRVRIKSPSP